VTSIIFGSSASGTREDISVSFIKMFSYLIFYCIVTFELVRQVWRSKIVNKNVIFGLISGFIGLGLIGFFVFLSIEIAQANSFEGFNPMISLSDNLMYYSYISLLTIGFGDIVPITVLAQKATILIGLMGQIYLVVITGIIVGKYINQQ
jgi:hypothetical protein